jgi:hypothetical protein
MLAGERPEELVMPVRQRLVAGAAIAGTVQRQRALVDNGAVTGWRPRLDLPGHGLARVESEGVKVEDTNMRLVTPVSHRGGGIMDLHGAVVTVHRGRGLTVTRRSRHWPRARVGRPERQSHAGSNQRRTGNEGEKISTPGNKGHSMPPLLKKPGPLKNKRRGPGNCYTQPRPIRQRPDTVPPAAAAGRVRRRLAAGGRRPGKTRSATRSPCRPARPDVAPRRAGNRHCLPGAQSIGLGLA